jgi:hypothetical protein
MAGEHFVAAELLRRGLAASVTMGNAKRADVVVMNQSATKVLVVEVKSSPHDRWIVGSAPPVASEQPWVFVHIAPDGSSPRYFVLTAAELNSVLGPGHRAYCERYETKHGKPFTGPGVCKLTLAQALAEENCWQKILQRVA